MLEIAPRSDLIRASSHARRVAGRILGKGDAGLLAFYCFFTSASFLLEIPSARGPADRILLWENASHFGIIFLALWCSMHMHGDLKTGGR